MADYQGALGKAVFDRLTASVTLGRVYTNVPQNEMPPLVVIGPFATTNEGAKGAALLKVEFTIYSEVSGPSRRPLDELQAQVFDALSGWTPEPAGGAIFGDIMFQSGSGELVATTAGEPSFFGQQAFGVYVQ